MRIVLPIIALLAGCVSASAQTAPLASWEDSLDGWQVNEDNGQKLAKGTQFAETGATAGKKSLGIQMMDGYRPAIRQDSAELAGKIKGKKLQLDVTAPEGTGEGYLQVAIAAVADGMEWKAAEPQDVTQDGKVQTMTFDVSSWPIPENPQWMVLFVVTNTQEGSQPKTVYVDNLRVMETPKAAAAAPTTAPSPAPVGKETRTLLSSWEDGLDGWQINADDATKQKFARDAKVAEVGVTAGKKSLAIDMVDSYRAALRKDDPSLAGQLKGKKLTIDVTAPEGTAEEWLQVAVAAVADGMDWKAAETQPVEQDGKPHTLTFDISKWPVPESPMWFNLFLVTNTKEKSEPKTIYVDNLRIVP